MSTDLPRGTESILVVDDEDTILDIATTILKRFGYQTKIAHSAEEALAICQQASGTIDLVLLDFSLPGMDGIECLNALSQVSPAMKIILTSGYATEKIGQDAVDSGAAGFLAKPFQLNNLLTTVRSILDAN